MTQPTKPCVVGLGKLGLPLAAVLASTGFQTKGIDKNENLIKIISERKYQSPEPELELLLETHSNNLSFTNKFEEVSDCSIFFIIVPTPSKVDGSFDNSYLILAISELLRCWENSEGEKTIVIVSTVMPGSCNQVFIPMIRRWEADHGNKLNVALLYSPEFIALGSVVYNLRNPDMTLIGSDHPEDTRVFLEVMKKVTNGKPKNQILSLTEAEIVKLMVNCFVTMKISFANFIGELTSVIPDTNKYQISEALGMDTRIGGKYLRPGFGFAGPCFPRDNKALIALAKHFNLNPSLALATDEVNDRQPEQVFSQIISKNPGAKRIGIAGISYKPDTIVTDESQTLKLAALIESKGLEVNLYDSLFTDIELAGFRIVASVSDLLECDVIVVPKEFEFLFKQEETQNEKFLII
jgi:UDPglucose 6-dehydrogenase